MTDPDPKKKELERQWGPDADRSPPAPPPPRWVKVGERVPTAEPVRSFVPTPAPTPTPPAPPVPDVAPEPTPAPPKPMPRKVEPRPEERRLWADPELSPWTPKTAPAAPASTVRAPGGSEGRTSCPRCATPITYARVGSPPWVVACPKCGATGRLNR